MMLGRFTAMSMLLFVSSALIAAPRVEVVVPGSKTDRSHLDTPFGIEFDAKGVGYIAEFDGGRIFRLDTQNKLTHLGGTPGDPATRGKAAPSSKMYAGDGGPVAKALFNGMHNLAVTPEGDLYLADTWNHVVRKVDHATGLVSTFAGTGHKGFSGDGGKAEKATFNGVFSIAFTPDFTRLIITDLGNKRIRAVDMKTRLVSTLAGNGQGGKPKDGEVAKDSPLVDPRAAVVDRQGVLYILERNGHALRAVAADGRIRTVAGGSGKSGKADGDVIASTMNGPKHLCIDLHDNVIIADAENHLIRKYDAKSGLLSTLDLRGLARPHGVTVHRDGSLYVVDSYNHRVLKVTDW